MEVKEVEEVELYTCETAIVAADIIDTVINGTNYEFQDEGFIWAKDNITLQECNILILLAVTALEIIISKESELNALWSETEKHYIEWRCNIIDQKERLS